MRSLRRFLASRRRRRRVSSTFFTEDYFRAIGYPDDVVAGAYTYGKPIIFGAGEAGLTVGRYSSIALDVKIFLGYEHNVDWVSTYPFPDALLKDHFPAAQGIPGQPMTRGDVVIGNDVWIGHGAIILSGVVVGDGAVIGAGAVVRHDVRSYGIAVGVPARVVKLRFAEDTIEQLTATQWWNLPLDRIQQLLPGLCGRNTDLFIRKSREVSANLP